MQQRARVFIPPQTHDSFISVCVAGSLAIIELDRWATQLSFDYGIVLFGSNDYFVASNDDRSSSGPGVGHVVTSSRRPRFCIVSRPG